MVVALSKKEAIENLIKLGFLLDVKKLSLYHGRTSIADTHPVWRVNPNYVNAGNATGNRNVNKITALNTSDYVTAKKFAEARDGEFRRRVRLSKPIAKSTVQVHKIVPIDDENSYLIDLDFSVKNLNQEQQKLFYDSLKMFNTASTTELMPVEFQNRQILNVTRDVMRELGTAHKINRPINQEDIGKIVAEVGRRFEGLGNAEIATFVKNWCIAFNTNMFMSRAAGMLVNKIVCGYDMCVTYNDDVYSVSPELIRSWCSKNRIIGCKMPVWSATLGEDIDSYMIFDLHRVNTEDYVKSRKNDIIRRYSAVEKMFSDRIPDKHFQNDILSIDNPEKFVSEAGKYLGIDSWLNMDAGVWEKFSVREHTETAIRIFEDSCKNKLTPNVAQMIRLLLLAHDIGKGVARTNPKCDKKLEDACTLDVCHKVIYPRLRISNIGAQKLLDFLITDNLQLASTAQLDKLYNRKMERGQWRDRVIAELYRYSGRIPTREEVNGIMSMGEMMFVCDGGAYSTYAITRDERTGSYYRNGNARFSQTFIPPSDLSRRIIEPKNADVWDESVL